MRYLVCCRSYLNSTLYFNLFLLSYEYIFFLHFSAASLTSTLQFSIWWCIQYYFSCSTPDGYVQCNMASCCPQISPGVYGSKSDKGCAVFVCFFFAFKQVPRLTVFSMSHCRLLLDQKTLLLTMTWCKLLKYWMIEQGIQDYLPCLTNTIKHKGRYQLDFTLCCI